MGSKLFLDHYVSESGDTILLWQSIRVSLKFAAIQTASQLEMFKHKYPTGGDREAAMQNRNRAVATQIQTPPNHNKVPLEKTTRCGLCYILSSEANVK